MNFGSNGISGRVLLYFTLHTNSDLKRQISKLAFHKFNYMQMGGGGGAGGRPKLAWKKLTEKYCREWKTVDPQERSTWSGDQV